MLSYEKKPLQVEVLIDKMSFRLLNNVQVKGYVIPKGFITDFASVPRLFWAFIPPMGKHNYAALLHDYLCYYKPVTRKEADRIFYEMLIEHGVSKFRSKVMYYAVRFYAKCLYPVIKWFKSRER